jgi:streptomycin 6-kinase
LIERSVNRWSLTLGEPFTSGNVAWVAPAGKFVLKISFLDDDTRSEPDALRFWAGRGTANLIDSDPETGALLLERLHPGTSLADHPDRNEAIRIACRLLRSLWLPLPVDHPFRLSTPPPELQSTILGNSDFHLGNILLDSNGDWRLIDPKPVAAERAFDTAHLLRSLLSPSPHPREVRVLVDLLARELDLPEDRIRHWVYLRSMEEITWAASTGLGDPNHDFAIAQAVL